MKILLVYATELEADPLLKRLKKGSAGAAGLGKHTLDFLITGVGMTSTAFYLGKNLNRKYDLAINAGVAGSFNRKIALGSVVNVVSDCFADLGAEDGERFLTLKEMGLGETPNPSERSPSDKPQAPIPKIKNMLKNLLKVKSITVNTVHGNAASIKKAVKKFKPDIESMEGAAFFLACNHENIPCVQLRAISNYVERRNKKNWKMGLAINNLSEAIYKLISGL